MIVIEISFCVIMMCYQDLGIKDFSIMNILQKKIEQKSTTNHSVAMTVETLSHEDNKLN